MSLQRVSSSGPKRVRSEAPGANFEAAPTGLEPATLTLATLFGTTPPPATLYIPQCFTGLLTYRSRP